MEGLIVPDARPLAPTRTSSRYMAFGLCIESELALPELALPELAGATEKTAGETRWRDPGIFIHFATLPPTLPTGQFDEGHAILTADGQSRGGDAVLTIGKVARYSIRGGREIAIDPHPGVSERKLRLFLLGSVMGILCHQRRLLPLHANDILVNGSVAAFAGRRGIGKSTLAAHFQSRGYAEICDDVCVAGFDENGRPVAWPGLPRLKLWRDAAETFGHDTRTLEPAMEGRQKYQCPAQKRLCPECLFRCRVFTF